MKLNEKVKDLWDNQRKLIVLIGSVVLALLFVGSMLLAVFSGGELFAKEEVSDVKGLLQINKSDYSTSYLSGDKFSFDKEQTEIMLIAKDPLIENVVKVEKLPSSEYGFRINGEGQIYDNAEDILMDTNVKSVSVVSKYYPNLKVDIPVSVVSVSGMEFKNSLLLEAESAKLYKDGELISDEDKNVLPEADKPYNSAAGTPAGQTCSGGACLRNLGTQNMKVQFDIVCKEDVEVSFVIKYCLRKDGKNFGDYFKVKVNGRENKTVAAIKTPVGSDYFTPADLTAVTLSLKRGVTTITFESGPKVGTEYPVNLDAIELTCNGDLLSAYSA